MLCFFLGVFKWGLRNIGKWWGDEGNRGECDVAFVQGSAFAGLCVGAQATLPRLMPVPASGEQSDNRIEQPEHATGPWPPDYSMGHHERVARGASPPRLFAARLWINVTASHVCEDLSKNRSAPSRRLRFSYSVFA